MKLFFYIFIAIFSSFYFNNIFANDGNNDNANLTFYGNVDFGYTLRFHKHKNSATTKTNSRLDSGQSDANRIGFRGSEDLSNGNRAIYVLEREFALDTGEEDGWTQTFLGFENEKLGSIFGGLMDTPHYALIADLDPFKVGTVGNYTNIRSDLVYAIFDIRSLSDSLMYISPQFNNFVLSAFYSNYANTDFYNLALNYEAEKLKVGVSYHHRVFNKQLREDFDNINSKNLHNFTIGGAYTFDNELTISTFIAYDKLNLASNLNNFSNENSMQNSNAKNITLTHIMLGVEKPFDRHSVKASLNYTYNKKSQYGNAWQIAVAYDYNLSKRTNLYAAYSYIKNNHNRMATTNDFSNDGGVYQQAVQFGIKHNF